ncbi:hypothetical protein BBP40_001181 [Aspergillus hancockii]|nr:hypothetical protein BBP40_001181 [Aspergillus hancockii]
MRIFSVYILLISIFTVQATTVASGTNALDLVNHRNYQHDGAVQRLPNVIFGGEITLNITHFNEISHKDGHLTDIQLMENNLYKRGDEGLYGFTFQLHRAWESQPELVYHLARFDADVGDIGYAYWIYMPYTMFFVRDNQLHAFIMTGTPCSPKFNYLSNLAAVTAGQWHKVILQAKWRADETGYLKIWFDGVNVLQKYNIMTTLDDDRVFRFAVGDL